MSTKSNPFIVKINYIILFLTTICWGIIRFAEVQINDDAMITFTYAKNLVEKGQFVFNEGEYIYGSTTPLFGLFVAFGMFLKFQPWNWVLVWDIVWGALIFFRIKQLLELVNLQRWFCLVCFYMLIDYWRTLPVAGMETGLYLVFIFSTFVELGKKSNPWKPILWASIAAAFRPEGCLLLAVAMAFSLFPLLLEKKWKEVFKSCWPLLIVALFHSGTFLYYGTIIPHSMIAKAASSAKMATEALFWHRFLTESYWLYGSFYTFGLVSIAGLVFFTIKKELRPIAVFYIIYTAFMASRAPDFLWYRSPLIYINIICGCAIIGFSIDCIIEKIGDGYFTNLKLLEIIKLNAGFLVLLLSIYPQIWIYELIIIKAFSKYGLDIDQKAYASCAIYLNEITEKDDVVIAHEIGYIGYFFEGKVYDLEGLVNPTAVEARRSGLEPLDFTDAEWFIHPFSQGGRSYYHSFHDRLKSSDFQFHKRIPWDWGVTNIYYREVDENHPFATE